MVKNDYWLIKKWKIEIENSVRIGRFSIFKS
jgi:hypothetical protein